MIINRIFLMMLFCASIGAMDDKQILSSVTTARLYVSLHPDNCLSTVIPASKAIELGLTAIPYSNSEDGKIYYAHQEADGVLQSVPETTDDVCNEQDTERTITIKKPNILWRVTAPGVEPIVVPFRPVNLALNKANSLLLIEGTYDIAVKISPSLTATCANNFLSAYAMKTKKCYELIGYAAKHGDTLGVIGFKDNGTTTVAEFDDIHQEWDLSGIEQ